MAARTSLDVVNSFLINWQLQPLSTYTSGKQRVEFSCTCGHTFEATFEGLKQRASVKMSAKTDKHPYLCPLCNKQNQERKVRNRLDSLGFKLIGDYMGAELTHTIMCQAGHKSDVLLSTKLYNGDLGCQRCYLESNRGDKSHSWNPNLTEQDRLRTRATLENKLWRRSIFEKFTYTCDCCRDSRGGNLVAHHLYSYSKYKSLRTDVNNGVCLCVTCHKAFHYRYGYGNNTALQYVDFKFSRQKEILLKLQQLSAKVDECRKTLEDCMSLMLVVAS